MELLVVTLDTPFMKLKTMASVQPKILVRVLISCTDNPSRATVFTLENLLSEVTSAGPHQIRSDVFRVLDHYGNR